MFSLSECLLGTTTHRQGSICIWNNTATIITNNYGNAKHTRINNSFFLYWFGIKQTDPTRVQYCSSLQLAQQYQFSSTVRTYVPPSSFYAFLVIDNKLVPCLSMQKLTKKKLNMAKQLRWWQGKKKSVRNSCVVSWWGNMEGKWRGYSRVLACNTFTILLIAFVSY